ncbi:MAG: ATP-binding protein [Fischerella sp. CENA71]|nr:ATP-binding protein [Fischerella sp. CENA71]
MQQPQTETITLEDIVITEELSHRNPRTANLVQENQALHALARQLVNTPETMLQSLVDMALELCVAGSTGVSLLETTTDGEEVFRWNVLAGAFEQYVGGTTPRNFSPCGTCLDRGTPQLYSHPERYFTYLQAANTPIVEGLVLPLIADNYALGTIWIMSHDEQWQFDSEDVRVMTSLADFTAAALLLNQRQTHQLLTANVRLEAEVKERQLAEESARDNEAYFRAIADLIPDLLWRNDLNGKANWYNQRWLDYTGQTLEEAQGDGWLEVIHPSDRAQSSINFHNAVKERRPLRQEHRIKGTDGKYRWFLVQADPVIEADGHIIWFGAATDIHEQRTALEQLRSSEKLLQAMIENLPGGAAFVVDHNLRYLLAEGEALHTAGFKSADLVGKTIFEALPMELAASYEVMYRRALAGETFEHEHNVHDHWYISRGTPLRSANGEVYAVLAVSYDITDRKGAEAALRESEEKYRSLFTAMDQGFCIIEKVETAAGQPSDFRYLTVNPAFERHTGMNDVVGKTIREFVPDLEQRIMDLYDKVVRTGQHQQFEDYVSALDLWIEAELFPAQTPGQIAVLFSNISERKRAEEQLRRAAEMDAFRVKLSDVLRSLADPVQIPVEACRLLGEHLSVDRAYYVEVNEAESYARVNHDYLRGDVPSLVGVFRLADFGWTVPLLQRGETIIVTDAETTDIIPANDREAMAAVRIAAHISIPLIKAGALVGALCVTESAPREWSETEIELVRETAERIWAAIERARAEVALRESEIQRIREQAAREEERQRVEALAELDRAKTLFFSNVSHEFRTPLTLLLAPLQDALSDRVDPLSPSQRKRLELVHHNSLRLLKLVNTLLDFSRIEANRMQAVYEPIDLAMFTVELASVFRSAIERAGLRLIVDCPPMREPVYIDREMWEKIVLNLLSNAFKFTFEGEIIVRLYLSDDTHVTLQVKDTGTGIPSEELPHLFERFYHMPRTQARTHEGSGIGLALVQELIQLHGGTVEVSSVVGQGTCFTVTIPLGTAHLPSERIQAARTLASTVFGAVPYVEEAERWLPEEDTGTRRRGDAGNQEDTGTWGRGDAGNQEDTGTRGRGDAGNQEDTGTRGRGDAGNQEDTGTRGRGDAGNQEDTGTWGRGDTGTIFDNFSVSPHLNVSASLQASPRLPTPGATTGRQSLQRREPPQRAGSETPATHWLLSASAHVLLVDDNADMRDYLKRILSKHVTVEAVADGAAALAAVQERVPDLVLSDVMMPGLNGFELLKALRADARTKEIPIILLSARAGEEFVIEGLEAGADDYLIKPFSAQELVTRVNAHLQMAHLRSEALRQERTISRRKDELLSTVSHELNTPLVAILGWTRLLRGSPSNQSILMKALETIERNATLQAKLIQDLLDISRITAGKISLNLEPVELQGVIETAIATVRQSLETKDIRLNCIFNPLSIIVEGDPDRLQQIMLNLLTNAVKFTAQGGSIEVGVDICENQAQIVVSDNGIGISTELLPYIFDTFRQSESAQSKGGLGLGLAIARHLIELHSGTINAASPGVGQGTTFIVKLPLIRVNL